MPAKRKDLTGMTVGNLTVLEYAYSKKYAYWKCRCKCGKETIVRSSHLIAGLVKSCGCLNSETGKRTIKYARESHRKHDDSKSRLYNSWVNMRQRCGNPKCTGYNDYGGRGIKVCPEWENDYQVFRLWALGNGYQDDLSIDRINNDGNYEPSNCRWANIDIQANNKRSNVFLTFNDETKTVSQWAKKYDISMTTFRRWLKQGKSLDEISTMKARNGGIS